MHTLKDTLGTLPNLGRKMTEFVLREVRERFSRTGEIGPGLFAIPPTGTNVVCEDVEMSPESKPLVWAKVRDLRSTHPIVGFVSEVWMSMPNAKDVNPDGSVKVMPRDDPERKEYVLFNLWHHKRTLTITAEIKRQVGRHVELGEWKVLFDSAFPEKGMESLGGAMMDGQSYSAEDN